MSPSSPQWAVVCGRFGFSGGCQPTGVEVVCALGLVGTLAQMY